MASLQELMAQRAALEQQINEINRTQRVEVINQIKALMAEFGLAISDVTGRTMGHVSRGPAAGGTAPVKYRNQATGEAWSGRGLQPRWMKAALSAGAKLEDFSVGIQNAQAAAGTPPAASNESTKGGEELTAEAVAELAAEMKGGKKDKQTGPRRVPKAEATPSQTA